MQDKQWQVADTIDYGILKENAKVNRRNMTEAESIFWFLAKSSGLGEKCRRQYIIGDYIVDFFFRQSKLIIEFDGGYHFSPEQQQADAIRQNWLEQMGYRVLRFKNEEVISDTDSVISKIKRNLKASL